MKKIHIISIFLIGLLFSCSTSDLDQINLVKQTAVPDFKMDETKGGFIDKADPAGEFGFSMDLAQGTPASADVKVAYINNVTNAISFATVEAGVTTYPYNKVLTVADLVSLFSELNSAADLNPGDVFTFFTNFTLDDGTVIVGYDENGPNYSGDVINSPLFTAFFSFNVACSFDPSLAVGSYHCVSASWEVEGDVTFRADPADPYKIFVAGIYAMEGGAANNLELEMNIDPGTFAVTPVTSRLGDSAPWGSYTNYYYGPGSGVFKSCDGTFEMTFKITVDEGSFGNYNFVFTRN